MPTPPARRAPTVLLPLLCLLAACSGESPEARVDGGRSDSEQDGGLSDAGLDAGDFDPASDGGSRPDAAVPGPAFELVAGSFHTCAHAEGAVRCWGHNDVGQLGTGVYGSGKDVLAPPAGTITFGEGRTATSLAVGDGHNCAILDDGSVKCWGANGDRQLGYGNNRVFPAPGVPDTRFEPYTGPATLDFGSGNSARQLALGRFHSCALLEDDSIRCWGLNDSGQLGTGNRTSTSKPPKDPADLGERRPTKLFARGGFTCALFEGDALSCWGDNANGQLGLGDLDPRLGGELPAIDVGAGRTVRSVGLGLRHACAVLDDATLKCWGDNGAGQLGYGDTTQLTSPAVDGVNLGPGRSARSVVAGAGFSCALLDDASVKCWGDNGDGQLGYGDFKARPAPAAEPIALGGRAVQLVAGIRHACAMLDDDSVRCWGWNGFGQLGVGDATNRSAPAAVSGAF